MRNKKKLGIIGGMGSPAAAWLFRRIVDLSPAGKDQDYLDIVLHNNSATPDRTRAILYGGASPLPELKRSVRLLNRSNAEVVVMACMTAYYYYEELASLAKGQFITPLEVVVEELAGNPAYRNYTKIGIIGSTGLLKSKLFQRRLEALQYEPLVLDDDEQEAFFMRPIYMDKGIKSGVADESVREIFGHQFTLLQAKGAEVVIGACSEVPLAVGPYPPLPFIDAFELLARKVVSCCYQ